MNTGYQRLCVNPFSHPSGRILGFRKPGTPAAGVLRYRYVELVIRNSIKRSSQDQKILEAEQKSRIAQWEC
jgi:hypothetical protein